MHVWRMWASGPSTGLVSVTSVITDPLFFNLNSNIATTQDIIEITEAAMDPMWSPWRSSCKQNRNRCAVTPSCSENHPLVSYLPKSFDLVVVVVGSHVDIFVDSVEEPEEELQGVVLGITTKLWSIFGHDGLERRREERRSEEADDGQIRSWVFWSRMDC